MSRLYINLARTGDILNCLPILKSDSDAGQRPSMMICKEYATLFEGISYADPVVFDGHWMDLDKAMQAASALSKDVKCLQINGATEAVRKYTYGPAGLEHATTDCFQKEAYRVADRMDLWREQPLLVFDRRNPERESELKKQVLPARKSKVILVSTSGMSSPFPAKKTLMTLLKNRFKTGYSIVDISNVKAYAIFDMLGLYESAHCLVAIDSAPLHLAQACPNLPVVALAQSSPSLWHGSAIRANHVEYVRYSDFANWGWAIIQAIESIKPGWNPKSDVLHVWSRYDLSEESEARHAAASETWDESGWSTRVIPIGAAGRDSISLLKSEDKLARVPGLKDVIRIASLGAKDDQTIICLTRPDVCFEAGIDEKLKNAALPVWSHRTIRDELGDTFHPNCDLFAFTLGWWKSVQSTCPEMFMGQDPWWPRVFMALMKQSGGSEIKQVCYRARSEFKLQEGTQFKYVTSNEDAHAKWTTKYGEIALAPPVQDQISTVIVNRLGLLPAAYNPSIIEHEGKLLMAYRWHAKQDTSTELAIAEITRNGEVRWTKKIQVPHGGGSYEDPRLFLFDGKLLMGYVDSIWPVLPPKCVTKFGWLMPGETWVMNHTTTPNFPQNDMTAMVKNVIFFEREGGVFLIFQSSPTQMVFEIGNGNFSKGYETTPMRWSWGNFKGGTSPLPFRDKLLRFFHSTLDNEVPPNRRRYYLGAMLMEPEPPFQQIAISSKPIVWGSETDYLRPMDRASIAHYKPKVIFPGGAIAVDDGWICSCGINDSQCALLSIKESDLNL